MALELESQAQPEAEAPEAPSSPDTTSEGSPKPPPAGVVEGINNEQLQQAAALLREQLLPEKPESTKEGPVKESKDDKLAALEATVQELRSQLDSDRESAQKQSVLSQVKNSGKYRAINAYGEEARSAVHQVMRDAAKTGENKTWEQAADEVEKYLLERFKSVAPVLNGPPTLTNSHSSRTPQADFDNKTDEGYLEFARAWANSV